MLLIIVQVVFLDSVYLLKMCFLFYYWNFFCNFPAQDFDSFFWVNKIVL